MTPFTCIDTATGEVLFFGHADDPAVLAKPGQEILPEIAPEGTYRQDGGWVSIPVRPSLNHQWDWGAKAWLDPRTLDDHKAAQVRVLKIARDAFLNGGFVWDGSRFDSDSEASTRLMGLMIKAQSDPAMSETWRLYDNSWRTLSAADAMAVWGVYEAHLRTAFQTFGALEAQVLAATSVEDVEAVTWP